MCELRKIAPFFNPFKPESPCHLHPLQAANCCPNSRFLVDEDDMTWVINGEKILLLLSQFHEMFILIPLGVGN